VRTAHLYPAQARRLCHQILNNFSSKTAKWEDWGTKKGRQRHNPAGAEPGEIAAMTGRG
jgi:hypothetical protein